MKDHQRNKDRTVKLFEERNNFNAHDDYEKTVTLLLYIYLISRFRQFYVRRAICLKKELVACCRLLFVKRIWVTITI